MLDCIHEEAQARSRTHQRSHRGRGEVRRRPRRGGVRGNGPQADKILYIYRLLVHDKKIMPMPEEQVSQQSMRHRLALWYTHQLPKGHKLLE